MRISNGVQTRKRKSYHVVMLRVNRHGCKFRHACITIVISTTLKRGCLHLQLKRRIENPLSTPDRKFKGYYNMHIQKICNANTMSYHGTVEHCHCSGTGPSGGRASRGSMNVFYTGDYTGDCVLIVAKTNSGHTSIQLLIFRGSI